MADLSQIKLPNGTTYNIKDSALTTRVSNTESDITDLEKIVYPTTNIYLKDSNNNPMTDGDGTYLVGI